MAASIQIIDDDDDDFDWEAAVQEIDAACQNAGPSTSFSSHLSPQYQPQPSPSGLKETVLGNNLRTPCAQFNKPQKNHRQLTLDNYVHIGNSKNDSNKHIDEDRNVDDIIQADDTDYFVKIDPTTAQTWIYPENIPPRDYQVAITKTALFSNTLVVLPTGLGKTLIAAVVMYNYFRWFPEGKIVFAAPSRPLVMQQIDACYKMVGIPRASTTDLTGLTSPSKRASLWKEKRVFFVTPQVLERDIHSGICLTKNFVCLVIDEAHRASGNFSFCVAVRELLSVPVQLRILALSATPGSKQQKIQDVIDNLHISTLEYRDESDDDVSPYVHNRKIELMQVPMGQTATEVNNLFSDVMRPIAARLNRMGVLPQRDIHTLSPCDLLNSRERFRQAPPPTLPHVNYGEIEGYFGVLITLYHIRKLLSGHGIKPAYEMLEEKLRQGSFARFMSRNEVIQRMKLLMQQSLSHGAPSPKLSKMIEVLVEHFRKNDPVNSRVIIFSNFRGSVRDIMEALATIGTAVKATQFVGQSSGKVLKGQTQKVQQAVLEKFRTGGYNVIVATSIGEEGLDIMEVDLVICFDANVSPLRMIQRMGRTGRKHDGRVVVLACEGAELKGYLRKKSNGNTIRKHMRNGGMNSFNFHSSPRMIPHIFKPEIQRVKIVIEEFVPRGRNVNDDSTEEPISIEKLTDAEADILAKYFRPKEKPWKPSLIAFPQFQAFPSRVHSVKHSSRTGMLIDLMQVTQGLSLPEECRSLSIEDPLSQYPAAGRIEQQAEDEQIDVSPPGVPLPKSASNVDLYISDVDTTVPRSTILIKNMGNKLVSSGSVSEKEYCKPYVSGNTSPLHSYLFGSEVASVDASGRVLVAPAPILPLKVNSDCENSDSRDNLLNNCSNKTSHQTMTSFEGCEGLQVETDIVSSWNHYKSESTKAVSRDKLSPDVPLIAPTSDIANGEKTWQSLHLEEHDGNKMVGSEETADVMVHTSMFPHEMNGDTGELELSPRLTNLVESGFVPESPLNDTDVRKFEARNEIIVPHNTSPAQVISPYRRHVAEFPDIVRTCTPVTKTAKNGRTMVIIDSPDSKESRSPLQDLTNNSRDKDWYMSSEKNAGTAEGTRRFKRLRKIGDTSKERAFACPEENLASTSHQPAERVLSPIFNSIKQGNDKCCKHARDLIDEEAQVSTSAEVSADEEDALDDDSYEGSFIDDRVNPTTVSSQTDDGKIDMMAIYRRSLLSQSPMIRQRKTSVVDSPDTMASITRTTESGESTVKSPNLLQQTPVQKQGSAFISSERNSLSSRVDFQGTAVPSTSGRAQGNEATVESRKRKLSASGLRSINAINLEEVFSFSAATGSESTQHLQDQTKNSDVNDTVLSDDLFFASLDLDALEAQATELLTQKANTLKPKERQPEPKTNIDLLGRPSFDLGIL